MVFSNTELILNLPILRFYYNNKLIQCWHQEETIAPEKQQLQAR